MHEQSHRICRQVSEGNFDVKGSNFNLLEAQNRRSTPPMREYKTITEHTVHVIVHGADQHLAQTCIGKVHFPQTGLVHLLQHLAMRFFLQLEHFTRFASTGASAARLCKAAARAQSGATSSLTKSRRNIRLDWDDPFAILYIAWALIPATSSALQKT